jgi:hypothetical protein
MKPDGATMTKAKSVRFLGPSALATFLAIGVIVGCGAAMLANLEGTWTETVYSGSGAMAITVVRDGTTITATGTITEPDLNFTFTSDDVSGSATGLISANTITGSGTMSPFGDFTYEGTVSGNTISGTYDFDEGGAGEVALTLE